MNCLTDMLSRTVKTPQRGTYFLVNMVTLAYLNNAVLSCTVYMKMR